ncbi:PTS sugar transporter subunit IIA [Lachnospiraceae bacterium ZAX-1]
MIGVVLVSHGKMAEGVKDSVELIMGSFEQFVTSSLVAGQDFEEFKLDVQEKIKSVHTGDGVIVFVDLFGASPYNAFMQSYQTLLQANVNARVVTGFNLPMVLEVLGTREFDLSVEEAASQAVSGSQDAIQEPVSELLAKVNEKEEDDGY